MNSRLQHVFLLVVLIGLSGCASGPKPPSEGQAFEGISLDGRGSQVRLSWTSDSMVTRALRPGSVVDVVVSYPTEGGRVAGEVASDSHRVVAGASGLIFTLNQKLKKVPAGPVCMQLRLNRRQTIPLRVPNSFVSSNEFYYGAWSKRISAQSLKAAMATQNNRVKQQLNRAQADEKMLQRRMNETLQGAASCDDYRPSVETKGPSKNVLQPDQWQDETERECTHRFVRFVGGVDVAAKSATAITSGLLELHKGRESGRRAQQLRDVVSRRLPDMRGYQSRMSSLNRLPVTKETNEALESGGPDGLRAASQGIVDAFDSCLNEVLPQFRSAYESWQAQRDSGYDSELAKTAVLECKLIASDLEKSTAQRLAVEDQLATLEEEMAEVDAAGGGQSRDANRVYSLLDEACPAVF